MPAISHYWRFTTEIFWCSFLDFRLKMVKSCQVTLNHAKSRFWLKMITFFAKKNQAFPQGLNIWSKELLSRFRPNCMYPTDCFSLKAPVLPPITKPIYTYVGIHLQMLWYDKEGERNTNVCVIIMTELEDPKKTSPRWPI